ncbi:MULTISPECIES: hypothetical protein [unclassified Massilia]|uniref:hypothetical protein n=1 Tax=Massilia sp. Se16.2.3 TaxID=2709303 RepID=UPI001E2A5D9F|nr:MULTISPECIES: hypothetical protein [unclassified Massilia]
MLASTFELLADAREQAGAVNAYIGALEGYWRAEADLEEALGGPLGPAMAAPPAPAAPTTQHSHDKEHAQ